MSALSSCAAEAIERRARRITLRVLGTNTRAQSLYLAHGYRVEGRLVGQFLVRDSYVDDVLMALDMARCLGGAHERGRRAPGSGDDPVTCEADRVANILGRQGLDILADLLEYSRSDLERSAASAH